MDCCYNSRPSRAAAALLLPWLSMAAPIQSTVMGLIETYCVCGGGHFHHIVFPSYCNNLTDSSGKDFSLQIKNYLRQAPERRKPTCCQSSRNCGKDFSKQVIRLLQGGLDISVFAFMPFEALSYIYIVIMIYVLSGFLCLLVFRLYSDFRFCFPKFWIQYYFFSGWTWSLPKRTL